MKKVALKRPDQNNPHIRAYAVAVKRGMQTQHVLPSKDGWVVKRAGASRSTKSFETQVEAIKFGKKVAKDQRTELIVHSKDGRIKARNSYEKR